MKETEFDFAAFYEVGEGFSPGALRVDCVLPKDLDPADVTRGTKLPDEPLRCTCDEGERRVDLVGTTHAVLQIVSEHVIEVLRSRGFSGWSTYPVEISCEGETITGYEGLMTLGRCGPVHHEAVLLPAFVPGGEPVEGWRGIYFDPQTWDGCDIFSPEGTAHMIVTRDVKEALEDAEATNWKFVSLPAWEIVRA